jgi:hypothetical protein
LTPFFQKANVFETMTKTRAPSDQVTLLVFKDNLAARTFQVPLKWISRLGISLSIAGIVTFLAVGIAARSWWTARQASPERVREMQEEIQDLRTALAQKTSSVTTATTASAQPSPAPTHPATAATASGIFSLRPLLRSTPPPPLESLPIRLNPIRLVWKGNVLQLQTSIQYVSEDGGKQNGRILIVATGPKTLLAYPDGALRASAAQADSLLDPDSGETFSVSRFREVSASFGPLQTRSEISQVQVMLLDESGKLLIADTVKTAQANSAGKDTHGPAF